MLEHHRRRHATKQIAILETDKESTVYVCGHDGCQREYDELKRLNEHRKSHDRRYQCGFVRCNKSFGRRCDLKYHIQSVHAQASGTEKCKYCSKGYSSKKALSIHIKTVHSETAKRFQCRICHKRFGRKSELQKHWDSHREDVRTDSFRCTHCEEIGAFTNFTFKYNLNKHIRKYHGNTA